MHAMGQRTSPLALETCLTSLAGSLFVFHTRKSLLDEGFLLLLQLEDLKFEEVICIWRKCGPLSPTLDSTVSSAIS